ncbi:MAG: hypothetical protein AAF945_02140 [Actinomycetota bacterium]
MNDRGFATRRLGGTRRVALIAGSLAMLAAACGSDASSSDTSGEAEVTTPVATDAPDDTTGDDVATTLESVDDDPIETEPPATDAPEAPAEPESAVANDDYAGAIVIDPAATPFTDSLDTTEATPDPDAIPECFEFVPVDAGVWYSLTPETDSRVLLSAFGSDYSWEVAVVIGEPGSFEFVGCRPFTREIEFAGGITHHILIYDNQEDGGGNGGQTQVTVEILGDAPPNDLIADAAAIDPTALPFAETVDTTGAGVAIEDFELGCPAPEVVATVFYSFTPDRDMRISVSAEGSDFSAGVAVGAGPGDGECRPSAIEYDVEAGVPYLIWAFDDQDDGGGNGGTLELRVDEVAA